MLKLERSPTTKLKIVIQDKIPFFSLPLFKAFLIAFTLHLLFIVLFHVQTTASKEERMLPPVRVEADHQTLLKSLNSGPSTIVGSQGVLFRGIEQPKLQRPKFQMHNFSREEPLLSAGEKLSLEMPSFAQLERALFIDSEAFEEESPELFIQLTIKLSPEFSAYKIKESCKAHLGKILDEISLAEDNFLEEHTIPVHLETATGKLFGFKMNEQTELFEPILKAIRFEKSKEESIVDGQLELHLSTNSMGQAIHFIKD